MANQGPTSLGSREHTDWPRRATAARPAARGAQGAQRSHLLALLALVALLLPWWSGITAAQDAGGERILRIRMPWWPGALDPQLTSYVEEIAVSALDYEGLTRLDDQLRTVPGAAESWDFSDDGMVLTFHLRDGLVYNDGSPLTAEHFRFAVERTCDPTVAASYAAILFDVAGCEAFFTTLTAAATPASGATPTDTDAALAAARAALGVRAVDDQTLEIRLTHPAPYFPTVASTWVFFPVKPESIAAGESWAFDPAQRIGNGPFRMTRFDREQRISFAPNEHYWQGQPKLDGIEYLYIDDPSVALEAYRAGDLDITQIGPAQIPEVQADPALADEIVTYPQAVTINLMFNLRQEPFTDPKVREAFAYGFDRETFCAQIRNGSCVPTYSWIPPGVPGHIETEEFAYDPDAARQALAESSYGGPERLPEITYVYPSDDPAEQARSEWLAGQYRDVLGVELELLPVDSTTFAGLTHDPATFPMMSLLGWGQDYPDPQNWLSIYWTCSSTIFADIAGYCNEEFDALVGQADQELDPDQRLALYQEAGQLLVGDAPAVFAFNEAAVLLVNPEVTGYRATSSDTFYPGQWASLLTLDLAPATGTPAP